MCGIAGIAGRIDKALLRRMTGALRHRGPDDEGHFVDESVTLGIRRLSIIDVAGGKQPIVDAATGAAIVYNGELYNYLDLREELARDGVRFQTRSDTEVVLRAYLRWGTSCFRRFNGMFAFALWDPGKNLLILCRDPVGIKPLHYARLDDSLLFASEIKALLQERALPRKLNLRALDSVLTLTYNSTHETMLEGIHKLPPGHFLEAELSRQGTVARTTLSSYWDVRDFTKFYDGEEALAGRLRALLSDAVQRQLMSEVPLGVYLSGGVDSSALVGLMHKAGVKRIRTFSVGFAGVTDDELPFARTVAAHYGTEHREIQVDASAAKHVDEVVWHLEEPYADLATIPVLLMSRAVKPHATVVLTGDGNDEMWAGYRYYWEQAEAERKRSRLPAIVRRAARAGRLAGEKGERIAARIADAKEHFIHQHNCFTPAEKQRLYRSATAAAAGSDNPRRAVWERNPLASDDVMDRLQYVDLKTLLPDAYLVKADRMTMAASVEGRVPYLDYRLVEFALRTPSSLRVREGREKYLFRKAVHDLLPPEIARRTKLGFNPPGALWLKELRDVVDARVVESEHCQKLFEPAELKRLAGRAKDPDLRQSQQLWTLVFFDSWCRQFLA